MLCKIEEQEVMWSVLMQCTAFVTWA